MLVVAINTLVNLNVVFFVVQVSVESVSGSTCKSLTESSLSDDPRETQEEHDAPNVEKTSHLQILRYLNKFLQISKHMY
jgi:hypothetical protein